MASLLRPESGQEEPPIREESSGPQSDGLRPAGRRRSSTRRSHATGGPRRVGPRRWTTAFRATNKVAGNYPSPETSASASATALCALRVRAGPGTASDRTRESGRAPASEAASIDDDGADGCPDPLSVRPTPRLGYPWAPTGAAWWTGALPMVPTANAVPTRTAAINCRERLAGSLTVDRPDSQARTSAATQIVNHAQPIHELGEPPDRTTGHLGGRWVDGGEQPARGLRDQGGQMGPRSRVSATGTPTMRRISASAARRP